MQQIHVWKSPTTINSSSKSWYICHFNVCSLSISLIFSYFSLSLSISLFFFLSLSLACSIKRCDTSKMTVLQPESKSALEIIVENWGHSHKFLRVRSEGMKRRSALQCTAISASGSRVKRGWDATDHISREISNKCTVKCGHVSQLHNPNSSATLLTRACLRGHSWEVSGSSLSLWPTSCRSKANKLCTDVVWGRAPPWDEFMCFWLLSRVRYEHINTLPLKVACVNAAISGGQMQNPPKQIDS